MKPSTGAPVRNRRNAVRDQLECLSAIDWNRCPRSLECCTKLTKAQKEKLRPIIMAGPDRVKDGVVRWRCVDLKRVIKERFGVDLGEISVGRLLKELGFSYVSARPQHPEQSPQVIEDFKKNSQRQWRKR
jgi:hypothetical protein